MNRREKKFCPYCGRKIVKRYHEGRERSYCPNCKEVLYENPFPAVAALVKNSKGELLLAKRAVEPAIGKWGLPGGFVEIDEKLEEAALRELKEETGLTGRVKNLVSVASQVSEFWGRLVIVIGYWVEVSDQTLNPGDDVSEAKYFGLNQLPLIAFSSHNQLIKAFIDSRAGR